VSTQRDPLEEWDKVYNFQVGRKRGQGYLEHKWSSVKPALSRRNKSSTSSRRAARERKERLVLIVRRGSTTSWPTSPITSEVAPERAWRGATTIHDLIVWFGDWRPPRKQGGGPGNSEEGYLHRARGRGWTAPVFTKLLVERGCSYAKSYQIFRNTS